jgi:hypothetical protein
MLTAGSDGSFIPGQRRRLHLDPARPRLPRTRPATPGHPALPASHQRKSRTLHQNDARRLGARRDLQYLPRQNPRPTRLGSMTTIAADHTAASTRTLALDSQRAPGGIGFSSAPPSTAARCPERAASVDRVSGAATPVSRPGRKQGRPASTRRCLCLHRQPRRAPGRPAGRTR